MMMRPGERPRRHIEKPALFHGLNERGALICVDDLEEGGKTDLMCPYCRSLLTAKKGEIVRHHFAHTIGKRDCTTFTVRAPRIKLPLYDDFAWNISPTAIRYLFWWLNPTQDFPSSKAVGSLLAAGLIEVDHYYHRHVMTKTGKMVSGQLSLKLFCQMQEPVIQKRLEEMTQDARRGGELEQIDLALFRARLERAYADPLVISLALGEDGEPVPGFYRIGTDVAIPHQIRVLTHRAHLLTYFQYHYADNLTERPGTKGKAYHFPGDDFRKSMLRDVANVPKLEAPPAWLNAP